MFACGWSCWRQKNVYYRRTKIRPLHAMLIRRVLLIIMKGENIYYRNPTSAAEVHENTSDKILYYLCSRFQLTVVWRRVTRSRGVHHLTRDIFSLSIPTCHACKDLKSIGDELFRRTPNNCECQATRQHRAQVFQTEFKTFPSYIVIVFPISLSGPNENTVLYFSFTGNRWWLAERHCALCRGMLFHSIDDGVRCRVIFKSQNQQ